MKQHSKFDLPTGARKAKFLSPVANSLRGVALVIVLAFVVLLTGIAMAFFSRAVSDRQVSTSSASQTRVELFGQGAIDQIVGDLKQEILAGSGTSSPAPGVTLYTPLANANAVPALSGLVDNVSGSSVISFAPNLLKRSAYNQPFYSGTSYDSRWVAPSRASKVSSTATSQNGRSMTIARWNKALLLPQKTPGSPDLSPVTSGSNAFIPPDWILVFRGGNTPALDSLSAENTMSRSSTSTVVGRYAYAIYDEGGLLDVNAAGYPSTASSNQSSYKPALAYADLTQIGLTGSAVDALVGWRNYASTQAPGASSASPNFTAASGSNYFQSILSNTTGFLTTGTATFKHQTDRKFSSRQEMILFFQNVAGVSAATPAFEALQYLTTFSRCLDQPSLAPDANAPKILSQSSGGNDAYGGDDLSLVSSSGDGRINPNFLSVRVNDVFTRNDGSPAAVGEPLVKKRFNLGRLAWLTYKGPSATRSLSEPDMAAQVANGITREWLLSGSDASVLNDFGLTWDNGNHYWVYSHGSPIKTLNQVAAAGREPDFFELLKASINAGALAKSAYASAGSSGAHEASSPTVPYAACNAADSSVDYAILQIGANIIDQFDADGYPTTIHWVNTGNTKDFVGIENLPYLNRMRGMFIKARESNPAIYAPLYDNQIFHENPYVYYNSGDDTLRDTGVGIMMWYPEIWNPHDWDAARLDQAQGSPAPSRFKIFGETDVDGGSTGIGLVGYFSVPGWEERSTAADTGKSPGFSSLNFNPAPRTLSESNTAMTFTIPSGGAGAALFREPTLLFRPGLPTGSQLAAPGLASVMANADGQTPGLSSFVGSGNGIKRANSQVLKDKVLPDGLNQDYLGFYLGAIPLRWVRNEAIPSGCESFVKTGPPDPTKPADYVFSATQPAYSYFFEYLINLRTKMQYQDAWGNWRTYDQKYGENPECSRYVQSSANAGFFDQAQGWLYCSAPFEPRTNRFGTIVNMSRSHMTGFPPFASDFASDGSLQGWVNEAEGVVWSHRMGVSSGATVSHLLNGWFPSWAFPSSMGWYPGWSSDWGNAPLRPGLFEQNDPSTVDDRKSFDGDTAQGESTRFLYYADADGVVRRAAGAWVGAQSSNTPTGLPLAVANKSSGSSLVRNAVQSSSRPVILNRPFRSVAELGYVFSGIPWKNLDFFAPESGYAGLLDVFCVNETNEANALVGGKVNLNTRQAPVLQAILAGAYKDEWNPGATTIPGEANALASMIADKLVARTQSNVAGKGPLGNVSDLVGRWVKKKSPSGTDTTSPPYGPASYDGFSADLSSILPSGPDQCIQRFREASLRALSTTGQTRVWNLMIDVVAQTGSYPKSATSLSQFNVEGETHYWVHVAIDRLTGQVIDKEIEEVKE